MLLSELIRSLEEQLLQPSARNDPATVASLLAADFREFGSSGRILSKHDVLRELAEEIPAIRSLHDWQVRLLADDLVLATYRCVKEGAGDSPSETLRTSIWTAADGTWRMLFHQGTKAPAAANDSTNLLLADAFERGVRYVAKVRGRPVIPSSAALSALARFDEELPLEPSAPGEMLALLDDVGSPATVASTGGRYFGFVTGGTLPAALAANWLAAAWDQNGALRVMSPAAAKLEEVALSWLRQIFGLPVQCGAGFVTGATMAIFTCLAAARHALLQRLGWDVENQGLFGAPPITVVVGAEVHVSLLKALALLGLGRARVLTVPVDRQGRMRPEALPPLDRSTILCLQAGNVNTGAFDPAEPLCRHAQEAGAWLHVDGAFGLWAAASPAYSKWMAGYSQADSWATDCHKWLNVSYDSGLAFVRDPDHLRAAMALSASYLQMSDSREPANFTPEASRRARGIEVWAALRSLGRSGLANMIERNCHAALRFEARLRTAGYQILNQVVLNQVLVSFGSAELTKQIIAAVQEEGTCWCGGTQWQGQAAMRISVSSWATTPEDVEASAEAIIRVARSIQSLSG